MNASGLSRLRKGAIFNAHNHASNVAVVGETSRFFGSIAMASASKQRTFATNKRGALLSLCFLGRNSSDAILANLLPRFWRTNVTTILLKQVSVPLSQMFGLRKAFKVVGAVVGFVSVDVVNLFVKGKIVKPTSSHHAVHKSFAQIQIPLRVKSRGVKLQLSDGFSTARNCVKMVKESVFDSFYRNVNHVVPFRWLQNLDSNLIIGNVQ
jgi:hypothetical protein